MLVKTYCAAVNGLNVTTVTVEVSAVKGEKFVLSGLGDEAVREAQSRIFSAVTLNNLHYPAKRITVNLAPADLRKEGSAFDLPIAIGILASDGQIVDRHLGEYMLVGELGLDGHLQPIKGALPIAIRARAEKFKGLIVPRQNEREAAVVNNLEVYGMDNLMDVVQFLNDMSAPEPVFVDTRAEFYANQSVFDMEFSDVRGQESIKRAFEVAAAGGHNLIMVGPPGSGKSMMAKRLPSILPPLSLAESLETTQIHSIAGKLASSISLISQRPFRAPHHTVSQVALCGGGSNPMPGEISLAHNGVLFCDELPEFNKSTLEVLRQPLEDRKITISRAKYTIEYPCSIMFVASMNPCPCGYYGDATHNCVCTPGQRIRYMNKISGPLLDRIDQNRKFPNKVYPLRYSHRRRKTSVKRADPLSLERIDQNGEFPNKTIPHRFSQKRRKKCVRNPDHIFLDRIDIQCEIQPVPFRDISKQQPGEPSANIRERVIKARQIQTERFKDSKLIHCNAQMTDRMIHEHCILDEATTALLQKAMDKLNLSARAYSRILKVARTIADLEGKENVEMHHVAEAVGYRSLDRGDWAER